MMSAIKYWRREESSSSAENINWKMGWDDSADLAGAVIHLPHVRALANMGGYVHAPNEDTLGG